MAMLAEIKLAFTDRELFLNLPEMMGEVERKQEKRRKRSLTRDFF
jgi:hypothetical protein